MLRTRRGGDQESRGESLVLIVLNASNRGLNIYTIVQLLLLLKDVSAAHTGSKIL